MTAPELLPRLFVSFFKIGLFTIGGGYAMLPLIEREVVGKRRWLTGPEYLDALALAQSLPGPVAVNSAVFVGYKTARIPGAVAAVLGTTLPSFVVMLLIAAFFVNVKDNPHVAGAFNAIRPAVAALIAGSAWSLAKKTEKRPFSMVLIIATTAAVWSLKISPAWVVPALAVIGAIMPIGNAGRRDPGTEAFDQVEKDLER
ncbi:MAG: chromate transporter [Planctomycetota bacterium]|nr:chromate transporter [Planctomycetota bacterium]